MMGNRIWICAVVGLATLLAASCAPKVDPTPAPQLTFEISMASGTGRELEIRLGVRNAGATDFAGDEQFAGQMEVRNAAGELRASAEVLHLPAIAAGETAWPLVWHGELEPGDYRMSWGSDQFGFITREFTVVERNGRLYLAEDAPPEELTEGERLAARAVADLANRLGIDADGIVVQGILEAEFPDASLGVPEPGMVYAQVITPGYIIELSVDGAAYVYHGAGERVVLAEEPAPAGSVTIKEVQVSGDAIVVTGTSTLADGSVIQAELLAGDGAPTWWPESAYATVEDGAWRIMVMLDGAALDPEITYTVTAWAEGDDSTRAAFPFDLAAPPSPAAGWPVFIDDTYGFQLAYPEEWTFKEMSAEGSGVPDDWPVERIVIFYPQAWADRFEASGPPDPEAPPAIPALSLEVCVGPEEQFRRAYYAEPGRSETLVINGLEVAREEVGTGDYVTVQYVFQSPADPEVRVVLLDNFTQFTGRAAEHPEIVEAIAAVVMTFAFAG